MSGNASCYSVQNLLSSSLLSKNFKIKIYWIIILLFFLYGGKTWSFTVKEERRLRVFENRGWGEYLGLRGTRSRDGRNLHNVELNGVYYSPSAFRVIKSRRMRLAGHVALMGERRGVYRVLVEKPQEKRPLGGTRRRWEDNIKMDLQEVRCGGMNWIELAQDK